MKLLVLGGSNGQLNAVKRLKEKGHTVVVGDYFPNAPAKKIADYGETVSTFDVEGNLEVARKYGVDGVMTLGTDQPVYTAAYVAEALQLPTMIDSKTAKAVTNKKVMKAMFKEYGIPTAAYRVVGENFADAELEGVKFPVVVKPLDSQGQRGVNKLEDIGAVRAVFQDVLSFSREKEILVEEYYESDEITLSGWVHEGMTFVLTITDRICCQNGPHIGICTAHRFPSFYLHKAGDALVKLAEEIVAAFGIRNGPIYFQMLLGADGIKVNEIACRIGGAYEDEFISVVTGVDILDMLMEACIGNPIDIAALQSHNLMDNPHFLSVRMVFARPGIIRAMNDMKAVKALPGVLQARYNFAAGYAVPEIANATARAGYMIITGEDEAALERNVKRAYDALYILDEDNNNLVIDFTCHSDDRKKLMPV